MSVDRIKADVRAVWAQMPAAELALRLVDFIHRLPADQTAMLTYPTLLRAVGKPGVDEELFAAINLLVSSRIAALELNGLFVDDDREIPLTAEIITAARKSGVFIHPDTGELVPNFESKIIPFFVPSARFWAAE